MKLKESDVLKWEENIKKAKELLNQKQHNQMMVAELALGCCQITWGGNQKNGAPDERRTVKAFAKEIEVNAKTLSNWIAIKKKCYDVLTEEQKRKGRYCDFDIVLKKVGYRATVFSTRKAFDRHMQENSFDSKMQKYLKYFKSVCFNFKKNNASIKCEKDTLEEYLFYCRGIITEIKKERKDLTPTNHTLALKMGQRYGSAAKAVVGGTITSKRKNKPPMPNHKRITITNNW